MNDIHSARHYLLQVVLPAYEELGRSLHDGVIGGRRDIAALGRAAEACLHLADHVASEPKFNSSIDGAPKSKKYVKALAETYPWFAMTQDIANSWKHRVISDPDRTIEGLSSLLERWALVRYSDSQGQYFAARKVVLVQLRDKSELFGEDVIARCLEEWGLELIRLGVIQSPPRLVHIPRMALRADVPAKPQMEMRGVQGEYFESKPVLLQYDEQNDRFLPLVGKIGSVDIEFTAVIAPSPFSADGAGA